MIPTSPTLLFATGVALALQPAPAPASAPAGSPTYNVIEFLIDDVGLDMLELYDDENHWPAGSYAYPATPNIDAIAGAGVTFRNCWAHQVCSPDRAAVLTGRHGVLAEGHPYGTGIGAIVNLGDLEGLEASMLPLAVVHAAEATGYEHYHVGKWHLDSGQDEPSSPIDDGGNTEYRGCVTNPNKNHSSVAPGYVGDYDDYTLTQAPVGPSALCPSGSCGIAATDPNIQCTCVFTWMGAQEVIDSLALLPTDTTPFILRHWFHYAHAPWRDVTPDSELGLTATMLGPEQFPQANTATFPPNGPPPIYNVTWRRMKAMVEAVDKAIGDVLNGLTPAQRDNTLIVIRSDNGSERDALQTLNTNPQEPPAIYNHMHAKGSMYQQGLNVPLIIGAHPDNTNPDWIDASVIGTKVDPICSTVDVWATMAQATLGNTWEGYATDGKSLFPVLDGSATQVSEHTFSFASKPNGVRWDSAASARAAVRNQAGFKLIRLRVGATITEELYDLSVPLGSLELTNLYPPTPPHQAVYDELAAELDSFLGVSNRTTYCFGTGGGCPCGNDNDGSLYFGEAGCAGANPAGAVLYGRGISSVANDTTVLGAFGAKPHVLGTFFQADNMVTNVYGSGIRCAAGNVRRLGPSVQTNAVGGALTSVSISAAGSVPSGGGTFYYQFAFRDTAQCGPFSGLNTTNGLEIVWLP